MAAGVFPGNTLLACLFLPGGRGIMVPAGPRWPVLWMVVFSGIPMIVVYIFLYSLLLLFIFCWLFRTALSVTLFAASVFICSIRRFIYAAVRGFSMMICMIRSSGKASVAALYPALILLVALASHHIPGGFPDHFPGCHLQKLIEQQEPALFFYYHIPAALLMLSIDFKQFLSTETRAPG